MKKWKMHLMNRIRILSHIRYYVLPLLLIASMSACSSTGVHSSRTMELIKQQREATPETTKSAFETIEESRNNPSGRPHIPPAPGPTEFQRDLTKGLLALNIARTVAMPFTMLP